MATAVCGAPTPLLLRAGSQHLLGSSPLVMQDPAESVAVVPMATDAGVGADGGGGNGPSLLLIQNLMVLCRQLRLPVLYKVGSSRSHGLWWDAPGRRRSGCGRRMQPPPQPLRPSSSGDHGGGAGRQRDRLPIAVVL